MIILPENFLQWLDWCLYAYGNRFLAITALLIFINIYRKKILKHKEALSISLTILASIMAWFIHCLILQPFPAVG